MVEKTIPLIIVQNDKIVQHVDQQVAVLCDVGSSMCGACILLVYIYMYTNTYYVILCVCTRVRCRHNDCGSTNQTRVVHL